MNPSSTTASGPVERASFCIQGVPRLGWKTNTQSTFVGSLSAMLSMTEHPFSERELNGLTALAFRTRWFYYTDTPRWCPSSAVGECHEEIAAVGRNTGWRLAGGMEGLTPAWRQRVVASIDRGIPAMVYGAGWNPAVAYGYADGGATLLVIDYAGSDGPHDTTAMPPFVLVVEPHEPPPPRRAAIVDALGMATRNWHTDHKNNGAGDYWYGQAAYDHWIADALQGPVTPEAGPTHATWWNMNVMCDARKHAADWLGEVAALFDASATAHLHAAAKLYRQEHQFMWQAWAVDDAFNGDPAKWAEPGSLHRKRIAEVLTGCRELESRAIAEIEHALS